MVIRLRGRSSAELYLGVNAAVCFIFTVLLSYRHALGAMGNAKVVGSFCILYGLVMIIIGKKERAGKPQLV
jgi:hypothetical protein